MAQGRSTLKLFLDSSVLFSAVCSPAGGSAKIFTLRNTKVYVSTLVLTEVERNVREKLKDYHLERFFNLAEKTIILKNIPNLNQIKQANKFTVDKDAPVLASAKQSKADIVLTLDQKHLLTEPVKKFLKPALILTPKMFHHRLAKQDRLMN